MAMHRGIHFRKLRRLRYRELHEPINFRWCTSCKPKYKHIWRSDLRPFPRPTSPLHGSPTIAMHSTFWPFRAKVNFEIACTWWIETFSARTRPHTASQRSDFVWVARPKWFDRTQFALSSRHCLPIERSRRVRRIWRSTISKWTLAGRARHNVKLNHRLFDRISMSNDFRRPRGEPSTWKRPHRSLSSILCYEMLHPRWHYEWLFAHRVNHSC